MKEKYKYSYRIMFRAGRYKVQMRRNTFWGWLTGWQNLVDIFGATLYFDNKAEATEQAEKSLKYWGTDWEIVKHREESSNDCMFR